LGVAVLPKGGLARATLTLGVAVGAVVALAGVARLGSATAAPACTITWDGGGGTTAWATAANWSGDTLPGATDHVCIPAGATVVHSTGTTTILSLQSQGALTLSGGTLALTDTTAGNESNATSIVQSNGTLDGAATLIVSSSYQWSFGTQSGAGETRIGPSATLTRTGTSTVALTQRTLRNGGTVAVTGTGAIQAGAGARIVNAAGATFDLQADSSVFNGSAPVARFENAGTLRKSGGAATSTIAVELDNDGAVEASSGTVALSGGDGAGTQTGSFGGSGATGLVDFTSGSWDLESGASFTGRIEISAGTLTVAAGATVPTAAGTTATLVGGTLTGAGTLLVNGTLVWTFGTQSGTGETRIAAGGTLVRSGTSTVQLTERTLRNEGLVTVTGTGAIQPGVGARIVNAVGATFDLQADTNLFAGNAPAARFENAGTLTKTGGTGTSTIAIQLDNDGLVHGGSGTLRPNAGDGAGSSETGTYTAGAGASVDFGGGTFTLVGGSNVSGAGTIEVSGGTVSFGGLYGVGGTTLVSGGTADFAATAASTGDLTQSGGVVTGTGALAVTGTFTWSFGTQSGSGETRIAPGATLLRTGVSTTTLT